MSDLRRWIARFSFSFLILAFLLGWESRRRLQTHGFDPGVLAELLAAGVSAALGMWGIRHRHRQP